MLLYHRGLDAPGVGQGASSVRVRGTRVKGAIQHM